MNVVTLTDDNFNAEVNDSEKPVLVDYWATWCGPCKMVGPIVEEMAIERTMEYMWNKRYWVLREQQSKGPADLYAYKIINDERIEYFIDAKGIHPNAKQTPRFKPRADLKFINRDRVIKRIVSIVHNGKIKFVEGFHSNYKNLEEKYIRII